jgi:membrane fusion protein (multidrug efflux system)
MDNTNEPNREIAQPPGSTVRRTGVGPGGPPRRRRKALWRIGLVVVLLLIVGVCVGLYRYYSHWESTDDAQIDGYIYPVNSRITGYVTHVTVDDNQYVQAGTVLVQLDPKDYEVAVANARAVLVNDEANAAAVSTNIPITSVGTSSQLSSAAADVANGKAAVAVAEKTFDAAEAALRQAEANDLKVQDDVTRYKPLAEKDEIPQQRYTQAVNTEKAAAAAVESARASASAAEQAVAQARAKLEQLEAQLRYAETGPQQVSAQRSRASAAEAETKKAAAMLEQAQLNLQYTTIVAPVSGLVGQRSVQPGQNVAPGQQLMTIVPLESQNIWVTANFKETQLTYMRPGQAVKISVDAYGRTYDGHVLNLAGASGARYSLLPPENATGNYVKVVQRLPVKIVFENGQDPEHLLRLGMSVVPSVRIK